MSTDLDVEIRADLEKRRGDWPKIATDAQVSHSWISQFVRGKIPNPGYETLKRLRATLGGPANEQQASRATGSRAAHKPHREGPSTHKAR